MICWRCHSNNITPEVICLTFQTSTHEKEGTWSTILPISFTLTCPIFKISKMTACFGQNNTALINIVQRGGSYSGILLQDRQLLLCNTLVSNHVNSDHVPSFSCVDVWNVRQMTSGVMGQYCMKIFIFELKMGDNF
jgi:hypothetical protein